MEGEWHIGHATSRDAASWRVQLRAKLLGYPYFASAIPVMWTLFFVASAVAVTVTWEP
jgi:hypothetical protein